MKFLCLCLSPAIDALVRLPCAPRGDDEIFKDVADVENVGGKALNVARWLALRGATVACGGLVGEDNAAPFAKELVRCGIADRFLRVPGMTRRNEMITWPGGAFKVNRAAFPGLTPSAIPGGETALLGAIGSETTVILSGSLPKDFPAVVSRTLVAAAKAAGATVVLDASGAALVEGAAAHPDVLKPNAEECAALVGFVPKTADDFRRATEALKAFCDYPIISDGGAGAWFDGMFVAAPKVDVVDTTAAGDTLLAEWCCSRDPQKAVAAGSAACLMSGSRPPSLESVERLAEAIGKCNL